MFARTAGVMALCVACSGSSPGPSSGTDTGGASDATTDEGASDGPSDTAVDSSKPDLGDPWDGGPPSAECVSHCACMKEHCSSYSGYPYKVDKDCTDHCGRFSAEEKKCWLYWCDEAKKSSGGTKDHLCRHAWGTWGLDECP